MTDGENGTSSPQQGSSPPESRNTIKRGIFAPVGAVIVGVATVYAAYVAHLDRYDPLDRPGKPEASKAALPLQVIANACVDGDLSLSCHDKATATDLARIATQIQSFPQVSRVWVTSPEESLNNFRATIAPTYPMPKLSRDDFPTVFTIETTDPEGCEAVAEEIKKIPGIAFANKNCASPK
ncbi:permease-like cell division protein FtsX [Streptosporangium sp. NPDC000396]|uniref:permease-like cell division protein FtsX n=1 Tax=Streptosporangium sp. NPDC000396 TaxID=3366185 RepID=UPI003679A219